MVKIVVHGRDGEVTRVNGEPGFSLMEVLKGAGFEAIQAICGGCRSCGTCHVYIDPSCASSLSEATPEERMILEGSLQECEDSRLSCQIPITVSLEGLIVRIPPAELDS